MVFLVLALTWAAVLTFWYRSRSQQAIPDSVTEFHHHLRVIERAAPGTRTAANRLRGPAAGPLPLNTVAAPDLSAPRPASAESMPAGPAGPAARRQPGDGDRAAATARRRRLQRRRRDVLIVLAVVAVATLVLTIVDRIRDAAVAQIVSDVALGGYLILLIRASHRAARGHGSAKRMPRRRRRSTRSLRRLRARPVRAADASATFDDAAAGEWDPDGRWDADGRWEPVAQWDADDWDPEEDDRDDDTAGFAAVTLRPAVSR